MPSAPMVAAIHPSRLITAQRDRCDVAEEQLGRVGECSLMFPSASRHTATICVGSDLTTDREGPCPLRRRDARCGCT
jgi:hypothetical protein